MGSSNLPPPCLSEFFQIPKSEAEKEEELKGHNQCKDLISNLPLHKGFLRLYHGFYLMEEFLLKIVWCRRNFKAFPTDILLATYPKSGTTWLKALVFAILNRRSQPPFSNLIQDHPLLRIHPQECIPTLEDLFATCRVPDLRPSATPRVFSTHSPCSLLPESVWDSAGTGGCRIVYVCRDPKDVLLSLWHFIKKAKRRQRGEDVQDAQPTPLPLDELAGQFCDGALGIGSAWDHRMEYWMESLKLPQKVVFLEYENMLQRPEEHARRLAEFLGRPFSDEEEKEGVVQDIVKLCSIDFLKGLEVNREGVVTQLQTNWIVPRSAYFRSGKAGGSKEELTPEIAERLDNITREKMELYAGASA